jgi:hypothetical protein
MVRKKEKGSNLAASKTRTVGHVRYGLFENPIFRQVLLFL